MFQHDLPFNPARDIRSLIWWWDTSFTAAIVPNGTDGPAFTRRLIRRGGLVDAVERPGVDFSLVRAANPVVGRVVLDQGVHGNQSCMSNEISLLGLNLTAATLVHCGYKTGNNDTGAFYSWFGGAADDTYHAYSDTKCYDDFGSTVRQVFNHTADFTGQHVIVTRARTGQWDFWCDGVNQYSTTTNTFSLAGAAVRGAKIPKNNVSSGGFGESILIGRYIGDDEMHTLNRYLSARWRVPLLGALRNTRGTSKVGRRVFPTAAAASANMKPRIVRWQS